MPEFLTLNESTTYSRLSLKLWRVTVRIEETDRDLAFTYEDKTKAFAVAERIAKKLHEKVLRRRDASNVLVDLRGPENYNILWRKDDGREAFTMKDYVHVRDHSSEAVILR